MDAASRVLRVQKRHRALSHPTKDPSDPSATDPDSPRPPPVRKIKEDANPNSIWEYPG